MYASSGSANARQAWLREGTPGPGVVKDFSIYSENVCSTVVENLFSFSEDNYFLTIPDISCTLYIYLTRPYNPIEYSVLGDRVPYPE